MQTPGHETRHPLFFGEEGLRAGWGLLLFVILFSVLLDAVRILSRLLHHHNAPRGGEESAASLYFLEGISILLIVLASWIMSRIERRAVGAYGLGGERKLARFFGGLLCGAVFLSAFVLFLKLTGLLVFDARLLTGAAMLRYGAVWLLGFLLVGIAEEYLLRGYLQFTLARGLASLYQPVSARHSRALGFWTAALILSFVFGFGHQGNPGESPIGLLSAGLAGMVFCLSLWRTGSLWWAIGFHTAWDWSQSFLYGVADSGLMVRHHLFATHPAGSPLMSGGTTGPEGSIYVLLVLAILSILIVLTLRRPDGQPQL